MKISIWVIIISSTLFVQAQDTSVAFFLPNKKYIPTFTASGTEHRISYAKLLQNNNYTGSLGGLFPALAVRYNGIDCIVSIGSTMYTTLRSNGIKYNVTTADFYVDLLFDFLLSDHSAMRFGTGHTSHHLADDGVKEIGMTNVVNYARDYYQFFYFQKIPLLRGFIYVGGFYTYSFLINTHRDGQFLFQCGIDGGNIPLWNILTAYGAIDFKMRSEVEYATTQSYQVGLRVMNDQYRLIRFAYTYRTGIDERGQFYDQRIKVQSLGLYFDF